MNYRSFANSIIEKIGYYVYLLKDPQNDEIFYVGKGTGDRVFAHIDEALNTPTENDKLDRIRAIHERGQEVRHIIHRHGLTEKEAFEVEAALIDLLGPLLTNAVSGHHSYGLGAMTIDGIVAAYDAQPVEIEEPSILIIINKLYRRTMTEEELYDVTRGDWVIGPRRNGAKYAFAVYNGIVRQVYAIERWYRAETSDNTPTNRWRFDGRIDETMSKKYRNKSVVGHLKKSAQNPIRYINCE